MTRPVRRTGSRLLSLGAGFALLALCVSAPAARLAQTPQTPPSAQTAPSARQPQTSQPLPQPSASSPSAGFLGFDRNVYPGDPSLPLLRRHFDFAGFWLTDPPGEHQNTWLGHRAALRDQGFGFLLLANGRVDSQILAASHSGTPPAQQGQRDALDAIATARTEGFPAHAILFLDQEEGGRLLPEQAAYLIAWTETVARSGFLPGVYASGQPAPDGPGKTITTAQDIRSLVAAQHLHPIALWVAQDTCPPSNGCSLTPPPLAASGTPGALVWQFAQSPRRPSLTSSCSATYAADGNCFVPGAPGIHLDLDLATERDPSHGR